MPMYPYSNDLLINYDSFFRKVGCCLFLLLCLSTNLLGQGLSSLLQQLESADSTTIGNVYHRLGEWYDAQEVYGKSIEYYNKAAASPILAKDKKEYALLRIGKQYEAVYDYSNAIDAYLKLYSLVQKEDQFVYLEKLSALHTLNNQPEKALMYRRQQLKRVRAKGLDPSAELLSQMGELSLQTGQYQLALSFFRQATTSVNAMSWKKKYTISQAIAYIRSHKLEEAKALLSALEISEPLPDAKTYKDLAWAYYSLGNYRTTLQYGQIALDSSTAGSRDTQLRIDLFRLLKLTYEKLQRYQQAVAYSQKYLSLQNQYELSLKEIKQDFLKKEFEAEREEAIIRDFIGQQKASKNTLIRERLEREQKERELMLRDQEVKILKKEEELKNAQIARQKLEREQIEQQLTLAEQQALIAERKQEAERQAALAKEQRLIVAKSRAERNRQEKALEVVKKEKALQQTQLEKEQSKQLFSYIMLALSALIVIILIISFRASRRAQSNLKAKSAEITRQNQELLQTQSTLQEQQQAIQEKNAALEAQQDVIQSSLNYALNIQGAILPRHNRFQKLFADHFIFFKPKDVVSGDFYWLGQLSDGSRLIATIDCTGHGIPGAFMSMIGHALMNELLLTKTKTSPALLLESLHAKIRQVLNQEETKNRDGMDGCICWLPKTEGEGPIKVIYAGARIPLYYYHPEEGFQIEIATKRSLGGEQLTDREFVEHELELPQGAILYLSTDGIVDQSNNERKRFGKARLRDLLAGLTHLPMKEQKTIVEQALADFQAEEAQRDDITLLGVKL